ncbi:hypothetical protein GGR52DRAFT_297444 [Hypoxylon sp. FL1284]|nr:hypothetical protein GGR52DRAFT_297444 [Hypoxylon sp. FL1284]
MNRLPETNDDVVTSWVPITTAYPTQPGCANLLWKYVPNTIAGWDPGYGISVDTRASCLPNAVTTWWLQDHNGPIKETVLSIGPVTCPQDYYTATVSKKDALSTFVACCPFNYSFVRLMQAGGTGQCTSEVKAGDIVTYATNEGGWKTTSSSVETKTTAAAIPVNGWIFAAAATDSATATGTNSPNSCDTAVWNALANVVATESPTCDSSTISAGAAAGIGVGVSIGLTGLMALGFALLMMYRSRKAAPKRSPPAHIADFSGNGGKDNASGLVFPTYSPIPRENTSPFEGLSERPVGRATERPSKRPHYHQPHATDVWDASAPCLPPSQPDSHANARTVPHGEMEGTAYQHIDERTRRRMEIEGTPLPPTDSRSIGSGMTGASNQDFDEEMRRRMELEGEFDRNIKVALTSPWLATARPLPRASASKSSKHHPPY